MKTQHFSGWRLWVIIIVLPLMLAAEPVHQGQLSEKQTVGAAAEKSLPLHKTISLETSIDKINDSTVRSSSERVSPAGGSNHLMSDPSIEAALSPNVTETFDYVIIVPDLSFVAMVNPLKIWKEQIGFHVKVVTLTDIISLYPGGIDNAERIWDFLHDRYPPLNWGIRYVLLVGDIDRIPMRFLFPDGSLLEGSGYGSDYYYANLDQPDWDLDSDTRWGEFTQDQLDLHAEVLVGRLPFNDLVTLWTVSNQIVDYEQTLASWKRKDLLVHGIYDYVNKTSKTDTANLAEKLHKDFFNPYGWTTTRMYEGEGISPSIVVSDTRINQSNYDNLLGTSGTNYGLINITMHGAPDYMESKVWLVDADNDNQWDTKPPTTEAGTTTVSDEGNIATFPTDAVVYLNGCETARVLNLPAPSFFSPLNSLFLYNLTDPDLMVKEYLANGSPAVIGSTAGTDYRRLWSDPDQWGAQTLNYLFYEQLIGRNRPVGDSFYAAMEAYTDAHPPLRGIRDFNYFGDPSLLQQGIEERPGGTDTLVAEGDYTLLAADNDANGDMYVGHTVDGSTTSTIYIKKSTNHGQSWTGWTWIDTPAPASFVRDLSLQVGRLTTGTPNLHVFYAMDGGRVYDTRLDLGNPDNRSTTLIGQIEKLPKFLTTTRTPGSGLASMYIYAAWEYAYLSDSEPGVVMFRSGDNGASWERINSWDDLEEPSIDAGPAGLVVMAALEGPSPGSVVTLRSLDNGENWDMKNVLTNNDGALEHFNPDVAVSTDPANPATWVAYEYRFQDPVWGSSKDLRFAFSTDNGSSWASNMSLASDIGRDEWIPDLASYRTAASRWINLAYNQDLSTPSGHERLIIWRYTSGGRPNAWNPRRIENDFPGAAPNAVGPIVVYSPGSSVSGGGVVYGGENGENIYFSAPWLATLSPETGAPAVSLPASIQQEISDAPQVEAPAVLDQPDTESLPLFWMPLAHIPAASSIGALAQGSDGALYVAAVLDTAGPGGGGHEARVYRSIDLGESWSPTAAFDSSWSVSSLIRTQVPNTLLAAGMALSGAAPGHPEDANKPDVVTPYGKIFRSTNSGTSWSTVYNTSNMAVYRLYQASDGTIYAGTGWDGKLLRSTNDGLTWELIKDAGAGATIHAILRTSQGRLVVGLEKSTGGEIWSTTNPAGTWTKASGLAGVLSVNDLLEANGKLYAGAHTASSGKIYQSDLNAASWSNPFTISPEVKSITRLVIAARGQILAGAENGTGASSTTVLRLNTGLNSWTPYNGWMDMASSVYDLLSTEDGLFAATGYVYGNSFRIRPDNLSWHYLPTIRR